MEKELNKAKTDFHGGWPLFTDKTRRLMIVVVIIMTVAHFSQVGDFTAAGRADCNGERDCAPRGRRGARQAPRFPAQDAGRRGQDPRAV